MIKKILSLGQLVTDNVTQMEGMLTVYSEDMNNNNLYIFQPNKLNPKTGQPAERFWITENRIKGYYVEVDLPLNILGTIVEDKATGFIGTAIGLSYHISGCVHMEVKPKGILETGESIAAYDFDLRRLKGIAIVEMSDKEIQEDIKKKPSPTPFLSKDKK